MVASVSDAAYVDTTAVPGVEYHYWIVSVANGGEWLTSEGATGYRAIGVPQHVVASDGTSPGMNHSSGGSYMTISAEKFRNVNDTVLPK